MNRLRLALAAPLLFVALTAVKGEWLERLTRMESEALVPPTLVQQAGEAPRCEIGVEVSNERCRVYNQVFASCRYFKQTRVREGCERPPQEEVTSTLRRRDGAWYFDDTGL